jgi:hypothetical protein
MKACWLEGPPALTHDVVCMPVLEALRATDQNCDGLVVPENLYSAFTLEGDAVHLPLQAVTMVKHEACELWVGREGFAYIQ